MKTLLLILSFFLIFSSGCRSAKEISKAIAPADTSAISVIKLPEVSEDSIRYADSTMSLFRSRFIEFNTFSAKIKIEFEGGKGKQTDLSAVVRIYRDSAIWISLSSTILNIEVFRLLIRPDSVILMNKQEKEVQFRSLDYLQEVTGIPFDYKTVQDLLIGNPVFYSDSIISFQKLDKLTLLTTRTELFKNLMTISNENTLLVQSKLDDADPARHRTASIIYGQYENKAGFFFPAYRQVIAVEKNNIDIRLQYKQYEFNKELSVAFSIPKNYKRK